MKRRTTTGIQKAYVYLFKVGPHEFVYPTLKRAKAEGLKAMRRWYRNHGDAAVSSPLFLYRRYGDRDTVTKQVVHVDKGLFRVERRR